MKNLAQPEVRRSVIERVGRLRADAKPLWGRMSPNEMVCHLADSYKAATGEKEASSRGGPIVQIAMKYVALYVPANWPRDLKTMPEMEQGIGGTPPTEFERDRLELLRMINAVCDRSASTLAETHPLFGRMTQRDWLRWGFLHADHHLRQFNV
jgi:hypothetical protein